MRWTGRTSTHRPARRRLTATIAGVALLLGGCTTGPDAPSAGSFEFVAQDGGREFTYPVADRRPLTPLSGPDLSEESRTVDLADFAGRVVVLNFRATWCAECRAEAGDFTAAADQLATDRVQFIGVNVRDSRSSAQDFVVGKRINYPSIFDPSMRTLLAIRGYPMNGIPSTIVLDGQGRVAQIWMRQVTATELNATVSALAAE